MRESVVETGGTETGDSERKTQSQRDRYFTLDVLRRLSQSGYFRIRPYTSLGSSVSTSLTQGLVPSLDRFRYTVHHLDLSLVSRRIGVRHGYWFTHHGLCIIHELFSRSTGRGEWTRGRSLRKTSSDVHHCNLFCLVIIGSPTPSRLYWGRPVQGVEGVHDELKDVLFQRTVLASRHHFFLLELTRKRTKTEK